MSSSPAAPAGDYPGAALGLRPTGPGSLASFPRRALAAVIDWLLSLLIVVGLFDVSPSAGGIDSLVPLGVFLLIHLLLVGTLGTTIGHRVMGIEVRSQNGGAVTPTQTAIRTLMVALFLPAVLSSADGRAWHDRAAAAMTIRVR